MKMRIVLAGLLGGLTLFTWGYVSHVVIKLGDAGLRLAPAGPADQALLDAVRSTLPEDGLYLYPGMEEGKQGDEAAMAEWTERTKTNPHGFVVVKNEPYPGMGKYLGIELATDIVAALVAAMLLSCALGCCTSFACRVGFVAALGLVTAFRPIQLWNWFEFPCTYTLAQVADGVLGFLLMGIVLALLVKPKPPTPAM